MYVVAGSWLNFRLRKQIEHLTRACVLKIDVPLHDPPSVKSLCPSKALTDRFVSGVAKF